MCALACPAEAAQQYEQDSVFVKCKAPALVIVIALFVTAGLSLNPLTECIRLSKDSSVRCISSDAQVLGGSSRRWGGQ